MQHQLDAKTATLLSNALIVEAERAQFKAAYRQVAPPRSLVWSHLVHPRRAIPPHPGAPFPAVSKDGLRSWRCRPAPHPPRCFETARTRAGPPQHEGGVGSTPAGTFTEAGTSSRRSLSCRHTCVLMTARASITTSQVIAHPFGVALAWAIHLDHHVHARFDGVANLLFRKDADAAFVRPEDGMVTPRECECEHAPCPLIVEDESPTRRTRRCSPSARVRSCLAERQRLGGVEHLCIPIVSRDCSTKRVSGIRSHFVNFNAPLTISRPNRGVFRNWKS